MAVSYGKGVSRSGLNKIKGIGSASVRATVAKIISTVPGAAVSIELGAVLPSIVAAIQAGQDIRAVITGTLPSLSASAQLELAHSVSAIIAATMPSLSAAAVIQLATDIKAVIFDGVGDHLAITSVQAGVSSSNAWTGVWSGKFNADNADMTLYDIGGNILLERTSANTIRMIGGYSAQGFTTTTTAISSSAKFMAIGAECSGHSSYLTVSTTATTYVGTAVTGSSISYDLDGVWAMGATWATADATITSGASRHLAASNSLYWADDAKAGLKASTSIEEWWDTSADALRDPGVSGDNATGASPLVVFDQIAQNHTVNRGTGNDAVGANSGDDTSPGQLQPDYAPGRDGLDVLGEAAGWWSADYAGNTTVSAPTNASAMSTLADRTANGNDLAQSVTASRPGMRVDGDGNIFMLFDANNDGLSQAAPTSTLMNNYDTGGTFVGLIRASGAGEGGFGTIYSKGVTAEAFETGFIFGTSGKYVYRFAHVTQDLFGDETNLQPLVNAGKVLLGLRYDKSGGSSTFNLYVNASAFSAASGLNIYANNSGAGAPVDLASNTFYIGSRPDGARTFQGAIYELALWDSALSDSDITLVFDQFASKYNLTL